MIMEIQVCRDLIADSLLLIDRLRESPIGTDERIVQKIAAMMLDKDPQAIAMIAVVAMLMLADAQEKEKE
jgi:hypothetical protein